ncbi:hypothetical protein ABT096_08250 [Streptomyces sp. NPDC002561]|uniref:hypothetical protein n=1 Tax=unclassified Streptomyces TaxID=2593676 RepID=UPI0011E61C49|nr:hypothetical protein [Streptomyces sp. sk2.1]TXS74487.1 hypothetical protein EAO76_16155 [Streptomyces sp. sk2.1]
MPLLVTLCVLPLYGVWWAALATGGGDLAAQEAWAEFAKMYPGSAYNLFWYGGLHTVNYSVISPYVMAVLGVVPVTLLSGLSSSWLAATLVERSGLRKPLWPSLVVAFSLWCQVVSGRSTFMLGTAFALGAVLAVVSGRRLVVAVVCAALSTMGSPVSGLFLLVVGAAHLLCREWGKAASLVVPPVVVVALTTLLFPFEGEQPMAFNRIWPPVILCAVIVLTAPRDWRVVRFGAAVYALGVVLCYLIASPIGTNVERLTELAAPVTLLAVLVNGRERGEADAPPDRLSFTWFTPRRQRVGCAVALVLSLLWLSGKTIADIVTNTKVPDYAVKTEGVVTELRKLGSERTRVEVVPARDHREAAVLAPYVNMARGWNRQADVERGRLFYEGHGGTSVPAGTFSPSSYRAWLSQWAVGFVVVVNGRPDGPAELEHELVSSEPDYLERVWEDDNWKIYRVKDATPLVSRPGSVVDSDGASLVVNMPKPGSVTVRVAYSPWLWADSGCLAEDGEFTRLTVKKAGEVRLGSAYGGPSDGVTPECP